MSKKEFSIYIFEKLPRLFSNFDSVIPKINHLNTELDLSYHMLVIQLNLQNNILLKVTLPKLRTDIKTCQYVSEMVKTLMTAKDLSLQFIRFLYYAVVPWLALHSLYVNE